MFEGYRDEELVGEGGLGRLYRAVRVSTGGVVAIKELPDIASASPAWHRARRELEALLRLKGHPYVVSVEEIIDGPNGPCIVMEYAAGGSLMERLSVRPMSAAELVMTGQHVTQALVAAHEVGIVHRDVKPHNVLVGAFGQVKAVEANAQERHYKSETIEGAAQVLEQANLVVIIPGYGLAVAQAQHRTRELYDELTRLGITVKFAIHPVAGRMPGHMNVLLAEAEIAFATSSRWTRSTPTCPNAMSRWSSEPTMW